MTDEIKIDISSISNETLIKMIKEMEEKHKKEKEAMVKEKQELEQREKTLKELAAVHAQTIEKIRFPGINKEELPDIKTIADKLGLDEAELTYFLEKKPDIFLRKVESASSTAISIEKEMIKKEEVSISGASVIELIEDQDKLFWSKYSGDSSTIGEDFAKDMNDAKAAFTNMKEIYPSYIKHVASIAVILDCRMSAYIHYRDQIDPLNELIEKGPQKEAQEVEKYEELNKKLDLALKEIDKLKSEKGEIETKSSELEAEKEQEKLANIPTEIDLGEEEPDEGEEQSTPKKRGRPKG